MDKELSVTITIDTSVGEVVPTGKQIIKKTNIIIQTRMRESEVEALVGELTPVSDPT